jgi:hypothetical protein
MPVFLIFIFKLPGFSEFPALIDGEAFVDPHEDVVVVDDFVGAGKHGDAIKSGFVFQDLEFCHVTPGLKGVAAQDPAYGDVGAHELFSHGLRHAGKRGEGPCMNKDRVACIEPYLPVVYLAAFVHSEEGSHIPISPDYVLGLGLDLHGLAGHYLKEKGNRTVCSATDPKAGGNLQAF